MVVGLGKFVPVTVRLNDTPPAIAKIGFRLRTVEAGSTVKFRVLESPSNCVRTRTGTLPAVVIDVPGTVARRVVELTKVVVRTDPPKTIRDPLVWPGARKPVPVTVSSKSPEPATLEEGES